VTTDSAPSPHTSHRSTRVIIAAAILIFAAVSAYLALIIVTRIDNVFFPGRQVTLPGAVGGVLPGVDAEGKSGGNNPINILVLGLDRRPGDGVEPTRSDTLFILRVDPTTDSAAIVGIPRDLMVDIPYKDGSGTYEDRVNTVYIQGELQEYEGGGIGLMKQVLEEEPFNILIDKYVIVDFNGFEELIDSLGGIDVDVPEEINDPYYSETELPGDYLPQHFEPGKQHMDGVTALAYSRIRFDSDDLDRIQRQQRVIFAAIDKAKSRDVLKDPLGLWDDYNDTIQTDVPRALIPGYGDLANQVKDNLLAVSLGSAVTPYTTELGAQVLVGDDERISEIMTAIFTGASLSGVQVGAAPTALPVRVEVQNGSGIDGLAANVTRYIIGKGYRENDVNVTNVPDGLTHTRSEIIDIDGTHDRAAYNIADWLGIDPINYRPATATEASAMAESNASIIVVLGTDVDYSGLTSSIGETGG
jgi:LCP family protein required for cell wall assembly